MLKQRDYFNLFVGFYPTKPSKMQPCLVLWTNEGEVGVIRHNLAKVGLHFGFNSSCPLRRVSGVECRESCVMRRVSSVVSPASSVVRRVSSYSLKSAVPYGGRFLSPQSLCPLHFNPEVGSFTIGNTYNCF